MVACRLDRRLAACLDPSDIVQDTLADAARQMDKYLGSQTLPFFGRPAPAGRRTHPRCAPATVVPQCRTVIRESAMPEFSDASAVGLVRQLVGHDTSPSNALLRDQCREQVKAARATLPATDREVLAMRYVEQLNTAEMAEALGIGERAVKSRYVRAVMKLRGLMGAKA